MRPDLAHLVSFLCVVDGVESGLGVVGDGVFSGDDGVAGLDVDGSVAVWCLDQGLQADFGGGLPSAGDGAFGLADLLADAA